MTQLVFLHGPGAGSCAEAFHHQLRHFPGSVAPELPGHRHGTHCRTIERFTEWVRGWLHAQGLNKDLVLVGYTLGAAIGLEYGLDYPEEVKGLVLMTVAHRPKDRNRDIVGLRHKAIASPEGFEEWMADRPKALQFVDPELRARLLEWHRRIGPQCQLDDMQAMDSWDVRERIATLRPKLLLLRGIDDPSRPPEYEREIHAAVPGSRYIRLSGAGHFPCTEKPAEVNALIEAFVAGL
jgi:pimeloyl-ACP methyl ester carboxylesterase